MALQVGDAAPLFSTQLPDGRECNNGMFLGRKLLLYFYPKDNTTGCTSQASGLRDNWEEIQQIGLSVIGVSPDSIRSHISFAEKFSLPFPLISDPDHVIAEAYGAWGEKERCGKKSIGIIRTSFLIDEEGLIEHIFTKVQTARHAVQVLSYLRRKHEYVN